MADPVVVRSFSKPYEAHLACSALQAAGIDAGLADEHLVSANWMYSNAVGGVKVLVPPELAGAARQVLENTAVSEPTTTADSRPMPSCPRCGAVDLKATTHGQRPSFLTWLLLGFPLVPVLRRTLCLSCGHTFAD